MNYMLTLFIDKAVSGISGPISMRTTTNNKGTSYSVDENHAFTLFFLKEKPPEITLEHYFMPNSTDEFDYHEL